jgi:predicted nucleic acid-binding Zn ribbon protein
MTTTPPNHPSCHDAVTMTCPVCQNPFTPIGRQKFCSDACRAAAYRRRRDAARPALTVPKAQPRRPITVYECDTCGGRAIGEQRCPDCATFMRKIGLGGECPHCTEPVAVTELLTPEVTIAD